MTLPINHVQICIVCRSRASGFAVGRPNRLGWFCDFCGTELALDVYRMPVKDLDVVEKNALKSVRELLPEEGLSVASDDIPTFLEWLIQTFGEEIRKEVESGRPPF